MIATFYLPVQNARDYFDPNGDLTDEEFKSYVQRFGDAVVSKAAATYTDVEFGLEYDNNTLGGTYWDCDDSLRDGLTTITERVGDYQEF